MNICSFLQQEGSLCAVHCLNALLQSSYYSAVDLAELANKMDAEEQQRMAEHGTHTTEYREFMKVSVFGKSLINSVLLLCFLLLLFIYLRNVHN